MLSRTPTIPLIHTKVIYMSNRIDVLSPVSGTVFRIEVSPGQAVQTGDLLAVIESMKMEIPVEAECDGTVALITTQVTASVEEEQVLFSLDT